MGRAPDGTVVGAHRRRPSGQSSRQPWSASSAMMAIHWRSRDRNTGAARPTTSTTPARTISAAATPGLGSAADPTRRPRPAATAGRRPTGPWPAARRRAGASPWEAATRVVSASMTAAKSATRLRRTRSARRSSRASGDTWTNSSVAMSSSSACRSGSGPSTGRSVSMVTPSTSRISSRRRPSRWSPARPTPELVDDDAVVALEDVDGDDVAPTEPMRLATAPRAPGRSGSWTRIR